MPTILTELPDLDRHAVQRSMEVVRRVLPTDLDRPTPCEGWTVLDLLNHMTAQHRGFAAASRGQGGDLRHWTSDPAAGVDLVADYLAAAEEVLTAFAADGVLQRSFALPEVSTATEFPGVQAIGFHFIDYVVHGWDVARALGQEYHLDDELVPAALRIAEAVPNGPERLAASAAFRPALAMDSATGALDRLLLLLGRSPTWPDFDRPAGNDGLAERRPG
jgi:uncharacterized protein (TIGR03086 family)